MDEASFYSKQVILPEIGENGQIKLADAKVLIVGVGGLGVPVLQSLAAAGVGKIGIIDYDKVSITNLHRQVIYPFSSIGKSKTKFAKDFAEGLNPFIKLNVWQLKLEKENIGEIFSGYEIIIDASDNLETKYLINDAAVFYNKKLIYGAVFKFEGNVSVFNLNLNSPTLRCLFPETDHLMADCEIAGTVGFVTATTGSLMAAEVIKVILAIDSVLDGKLLVYNALTAEIKHFKFDAKPASRQISIDNLKRNTNKSLEISENELQSLINQSPNFQLIDVRASFEHKKQNLGGKNIPLVALKNRYLEIDRTESVVFYCELGPRSKLAAQFLTEKGFSNVRFLVGGMHASTKLTNKTKPTMD